MKELGQLKVAMQVHDILTGFKDSILMSISHPVSLDALCSLTNGVFPINCSYADEWVDLWVREVIGKDETELTSCCRSCLEISVSEVPTKRNKSHMIVYFSLLL